MPALIQWCLVYSKAKGQLALFFPELRLPFPDEIHALNSPSSALGTGKIHSRILDVTDCLPSRQLFIHQASANFCHDRCRTEPSTTGLFPPCIDKVSEFRFPSFGHLLDRSWMLYIVRTEHVAGFEPTQTRNNAHCYRGVTAMSRNNAIVSPSIHCLRTTTIDVVGGRSAGL